jgi:hypothetical protein
VYERRGWLYAWVGYCNSPLNKRIPIIIVVVFSLIGFPHKSLCQLCVCCSWFNACLILLVLCYVFLPLHNIHNNGIFSLWDARSQGWDVIGCLDWLSTTYLGLEGNKVEEWNRFAGNLRYDFINLHDEEEESLCWLRNVRTCNYTVKLGYQAIVEFSFSGVRKWCWLIVWKLHVSITMKILFWLALEVKKKN